MSLSSRISLIVVMTIGLSGVGFVGAVLAQNPHASPPPASRMMQSTTQQGAPRGHSMADMQADQKKLDDLVAAMNAATGADKVDKIAAVVTELAARENRMSARMMHMMGSGGMMNMQPGATAPQQAPGAGTEHEQHHPGQ